MEHTFFKILGCAEIWSLMSHILKVRILHLAEVTSNYGQRAKQRKQAKKGTDILCHFVAKLIICVEKNVINAATRVHATETSSEVIVSICTYLFHTWA